MRSPDERAPELAKRFEEILRAHSHPERMIELLSAYPDDDDADAIALGGDALMRLGRYEEALEAWRALVALRPGDRRAEIGLAALGLAPPLGAAAPVMLPLDLARSAPPAIVATPAPAQDAAHAVAQPAAAPAKRGKAAKSKPSVAAAPAPELAPAKPSGKRTVPTSAAALGLLSVLFLAAAAGIWIFTWISMIAVVALAGLGLAGGAITAGLALRQTWGPSAALAFAGAAAALCLGFAVGGPWLGAHYLVALGGGGAFFLAAAGFGLVVWRERAKGAVGGAEAAARAA